MLPIKTYLYAAALIAILASGAYVKWLYGSRESYKASAEFEQAEKIKAIQTIAKIQEDASREAKNRTEYLSKLEQAENERSRLQNCIADKSCVATIRVRAPVSTCAAAKADNPAGTSSANAVLTPDSQRAYFNLRDGIGQIEAKYAFCQETLRNWSD